LENGSKLTVIINDEITLTATPVEGYKFKQWQGDASGSEATITIKMNGNQNVTAIFEEEKEEKPPTEISSKAIYDSKTNTLSLEGILVPYKDMTMKQRHIDYPIFHVEDMTETDSCN